MYFFLLEFFLGLLKDFNIIIEERIMILEFFFININVFVFYLRRVIFYVDVVKIEIVF